MDKLEKYKNDYEEFVNDEKDDNNMTQIYKGTNKKNNTDICLKIISKEKLKAQDYNYIVSLERLKKEEEILILCNLDNTVNFIKD